MSRPRDWSPLGLSGDPTPGDGCDVATLAKRYQDTADEIERQAAQLRKLADTACGAWHGDAATAFSSHAADLADRITKAHHRYTAAAAALRDWVSPLEDAQRRADAALEAARQAQADQRANAPSPGTPPPNPTPQQQTAERRRAAAYDTASGALQQARRRADDAAHDYHAAATRAASAIHDVIDHDQVHDSFWDEVSGWIHDHADAIKLVLKVVGYVVTALAIAALVIALFVPGLNVLVAGVALTTILEGLAAGLTFGMLVGHLALAANGDGNWLDVGLDVLALATFGVGGMLGRGLAATARDAEALAADTAATRAASEFTQAHALSRAVYSIADRIPLLRRIVDAGGHLAALDDGAASAASAARQTILDLPEMETTLLGRLRFAGEETAAAVAKVSRHADVVPGVADLDAAATRATSLGARGALVKYGGFLLDGGNHVAEDTGGTHLIEPYVTAPILPMPWKGTG